MIAETVGIRKENGTDWYYASRSYSESIQSDITTQVIRRRLKQQRRPTKDSNTARPEYCRRIVQFKNPLPLHILQVLDLDESWETSPHYTLADYMTVSCLTDWSAAGLPLISIF